MENRGSSHGHGSHRSLSMSSDTESQYQSPLRSDSPFRSDDPEPLPPEKSLSLSKSTSKPIAAVDRFFSPLRSPSHYQNHNQNQNPNQKRNLDMNLDSPPPAKTPTSMVVFNKLVREEAAGVTKVGHAGGGEGSLEDGVGGERRSRAAVAAILRRSKREEMVERAELGFRVFEVVVCLISFSVMAADKTQGWSGDSFDRYKEYRYCVAVNVIGFVYAGLQACDLAYHLATGKHAVFHPLRCHFDFAMDQILAYLLISASSSAATRVYDWVSNWGKDEFTEMASASISMSFLAFVAFSLSALISGYKLCNRSTTT